MSKKDTAARVLRSWLTASGLRFTETDKGVVLSGRHILLSEDPGRVTGDGSICVSIDGLVSTDMARALETYWSVTEQCGHGRPNPIKRTAVKVRYGQDLLLVAGRHREFVGAPDLSREEAKIYAPVIRGMCGRFYRMNQHLCKTHSYDIDDLSTFAWMWAHIYAHRYRRGEISDTRLLSAYLRQRFSHLHFQLKSRLTAVKPDKGTVIDVLLREQDADDTELSDAEPCERDISALQEKLVAMPHDSMVRALLTQAHNQNRDQVTRMTALRMLRKHAKSCGSCAGSDFSLHGQPVAERGEEHVTCRDLLGRAERSEDLNL